MTIAMASSFTGLLLLSLVLLLLCYLCANTRRSENTLLPIDWPILGMLPSFLANRLHFNEYATAILAASNNNFKVRGPAAATNLSFFLTCDPENARHIFTRNFANYPKGDEFAAVFAVLDGTIFTSDGESWRQQRARIQHVLTRPRLLDIMSRCCRDKVAGGLVPLLSLMASTGAPFDMQDILGRLVLDLTVMLVFGDDPCYLSVGGMQPVDVATALDSVMDVAYFRHTVPTVCWKVMRRLNVGPERDLGAAEAVLRGFVAEKIGSRMLASRVPAGGEMDILSHYINDPDYFDDARKPTDFLHRTFINFMVALRDPVGAALPWLVYNLAMHPRVVSTVRRELAPIAASRKSRVDDGEAMVIFDPEETKGLLYLRAAMFESLRLYPPGPMERKAVHTDDVLPSGHNVCAGETVMVSVYAMGRMKGLWGEDCLEYLPERWLTDDGTALRYVPSYKFLSFNTGPRSCLGKNIAVAQMTCVAAAMAWNFDVEVVEGHVVEPKLSVTLQMKNGLRVKVKKRDPESCI